MLHDTYHCLFFFFFISISPVKNEPIVLLFRERAAKQKRGRISCLKCSVTGKGCSRRHIKVPYLATIKGVICCLWTDKLQYLGQHWHRWWWARNVAQWERESGIFRMGFPSSQVFRWSGSWCPSTELQLEWESLPESQPELLSSQVASEQLGLHEGNRVYF